MHKLSNLTVQITICHAVPPQRTIQSSSSLIVGFFSHAINPLEWLSRTGSLLFGFYEGLHKALFQKLFGPGC